jgi:hypothetical protein
MSDGHTLSVLLQNELVTLNRAFGMLRRRNLSIKSIAVGPSASPGLARLTIMMQTDQATADRTASSWTRWSACGGRRVPHANASWRLKAGGAGARC